MQQAAEIPRTGFPDQSLALLREGYEFIGRRCRRYGTDAFRTRLLLHDVLCVTGPEAARLFYGGGRFTRKSAMPATVLKLLQDKDSVQWLDGDAHRHRKTMFMAMTRPESLARLEAATEDAWTRRLASRRQAATLVLHDELLIVLTEAACAWAGVPLAAGEAERRAAEFEAMIEGSGSVGPRNWRGMALRRRSERWATGAIEALRADGTAAADETPGGRIARHRDLEGKLLEPETAAVELLNVLRPTAAVARFIVFAALTLHEHPRWHEAFASGAEEDLAHFLQEVRRLTPFFPCIGGRAREEIDWKGTRLSPGQWVILDLFGTCRDPRLWDEPLRFRPERFRERPPGAFDLIPQGGGEPLTDHRCPGEDPTLTLMKLGVRFLTRRLSYRIPEQDLSVDLTRVPALPKSGLILADVRSR